MDGSLDPARRLAGSGQWVVPGWNYGWGLPLGCIVILCKSPIRGKGMAVIHRYREQGLELWASLSLYEVRLVVELRVLGL